MKKKLTTSVAICTYNGEKYIAEQLDSIINQTIKPNQIVISDDNSSDNTITIIEEKLSGSGVDYLININRPGLGITLNFDKSFTLCTGDIIFPCDQDNVWEPVFIESFLQYFENRPEVSLAYCNGYVTDSCLERIKKTYDDKQMVIDDKKQFFRISLNKTFNPHGHTIAVRRGFAIKCLPSGFYYDCWLTMCAAAEESVGTLNKCLINFRRHNEAASFAEGGGERQSIWSKMNTKSFDEFFVWPGMQHDAYERYLELYGEILDASVKAEAVEHSAFEEKLNDLRNMKLLRRQITLYILFRGVFYKKYRGNRNTYIMDALYLSKRIH